VDRDEVGIALDRTSAFETLRQSRHEINRAESQHLRQLVVKLSMVRSLLPHSNDLPSYAASDTPPVRGRSRRTEQALGMAEQQRSAPMQLPRLLVLQINGILTSALR
jgi:hypothetical protein